jgi:hypothetical protein
MGGAALLYSLRTVLSRDAPGPSFLYGKARKITAILVG